MTNKFISGLVVAILAMGFIVWLHERQSQPTTDARIGKLVFPGLRASLNSIQEVKLSSANQTTTIDHKGNKWKVAEKGGYEADFNKLSSFLDGLAKAKYVERKTDKQSNLHLLGLSGIDNSSSKATQVTVTTSDGSDYALLIGNRAEGESGRYIRKPTDSQAWLADHIKTVSSDPLKWIETVILSVDSSQVKSVTDTSADGKQVLTVARENTSGKWQIHGLPKGAELQYPTIADSLARALENVQATDVRARGNTSWKQAATADYLFNDGSTLVVRAMKDKNGQHWLRFDLKKSKKPSEDISFIDESRLAMFEFKVPDYTYAQFTKTMSDMIKHKDKTKQKS